MSHHDVARRRSHGPREHELREAERRRGRRVIVRCPTCPHPWHPDAPCAAVECRCGWRLSL